MPIALLTDFGNEDWFAGEMKGAILSTSPQTTIIDLTHSVKPGNIREGACALLCSYRSFPPGTVFLCSVSYGNIHQKAIAVHSDSYCFLSPDNGLLSWSLKQTQNTELREIDTHRFMHPSGCGTFPARDLLAPLGGKLHEGMDFSECGTLIPEYTELPWPKPEISEKSITAEIIYIDRFGNAVTSVSAQELNSSGHDFGRVEMNGKTIPLGYHYEEVLQGSPVAYPGSGGLMEIGINGGSAEERYGLEIGGRVVFF
ncbi:MAG: S-adenosyl-l-methionine hydroxide adenosyltransferase family protein [Chitinispirillaceae bacterium]